MPVRRTREAEDLIESLRQELVGLYSSRGKFKSAFVVRLQGDEFEVDQIVEVSKEDRVVESRSLLELGPAKGSGYQRLQEPPDHEEVGALHHADAVIPAKRTKNSCSSRESEPTCQSRTF